MSILSEPAAEEIQTGIHVSFRARPLNEAEKLANERVVVHPGLENGSIRLETNPKRNPDFHQATAKNYASDAYFGPEDDTEYIYDATCRNVVSQFIDGYNGTILCYGPTGTGKTHTMFGTQESPGLVPLVLDDVLTRSNPGWTKKVSLSALEVYKNEIRDLFHPNRRDPTKNVVKLLSSADGIHCSNRQLRNIVTLEQALEFIDLAKATRTTHETCANAQSSRSHCIIQLIVEQEKRGYGGTVVLERKRSKLNMVDLAGSERVNQTGLRMGERMTEACNINSSLLALKKCISGLSTGKNHIPFRDSRLTRLLQDCLEDSQTYIIATISPSEEQWQATRDTLEYGTQARAIKMSAKKQYVPRVSLREQVQMLQESNNDLIHRLRMYEKEEARGRMQMQRLEEENRKRRVAMEQEMEKREAEHRAAIEKRKQDLLESFKKQTLNSILMDEKLEEVATIEEELKSQVRNRMCVVCLDKLATHAMVACGHRCVCNDCGRQLLKRSHGRCRCPMCRKQTNNIVKIYL